VISGTLISTTMCLILVVTVDVPLLHINTQLESQRKVIEPFTALRSTANCRSCCLILTIDKSFNNSTSPSLLCRMFNYTELLMYSMCSIGAEVGHKARTNLREGSIVFILTS
jgi:hypothetical protein